MRSSHAQSESLAVVPWLHPPPSPRRPRDSGSNVVDIRRSESRGLRIYLAERMPRTDTDARTRFPTPRIAASKESALVLDDVDDPVVGVVEGMLYRLPKNFPNQMKCVYPFPYALMFADRYITCCR